MKKLIAAVMSLSMLMSSNVVADEAAKITVLNAKDNIYILQGAGGNIGLLASESGLLLVDDKYAPLAEKIEQAMATMTEQKLKYIVNTHYHGDHTGGNEYFSSHAPIFAHENVRKRLDNNTKVAKAALPVVTYEDGINIYLDDEHIQLSHLPNGHTDSDTIVYFKKSNVLHTGDLFFEIGFPYIDLNGGGNVNGYLKNVNYMINEFPDDVVIIPGHGKLTDKSGLKAFATMLEYSIERVGKAKADGMSEADILAMGIGEKYEHLSWSFIDEEKWLKTLIQGL